MIEDINERSEQGNEKVIDLLKDLFACLRRCQNDIHGINGQTFALKSFMDASDVRFKKCVVNIENYTRYIYDGDKYGCFPKVSDVLERARDYLKSIEAFGEFNDYTGFSKEK